MINNLSLSTATIENGERLTVGWSAENDGDSESAITDTHFYLSTDREFDIDQDLFLASDGLGRLDPGERENDDERLEIPDHVFEGDYYILAVADGENIVFESDESNNVEDSPRLTITDNIRPDLIIRNTELDFDSVDGISVIEGQRARIAYTCLLYTSPSPRDQRGSRMPSSA